MGGAPQSHTRDSLPPNRTQRRESGQEEGHTQTPTGNLPWEHSGSQTGMVSGVGVKVKATAVAADGVAPEQAGGGVGGSLASTGPGMRDDMSVYVQGRGTSPCSVHISPRFMDSGVPEWACSRQNASLICPASLSPGKPHLKMLKIRTPQQSPRCPQSPPDSPSGGTHSKWRHKPTNQGKKVRRGLGGLVCAGGAVNTPTSRGSRLPTQHSWRPPEPPPWAQLKALKKKNHNTVTPHLPSLLEK